MRSFFLPVWSRRWLEMWFKSDFTDVSQYVCSGCSYRISTCHSRTLSNLETRYCKRATVCGQSCWNKLSAVWPDSAILRKERWWISIIMLPRQKAYILTRPASPQQPTQINLVMMGHKSLIFHITLIGLLSEHSLNAGDKVAAQFTKLMRIMLGLFRICFIRISFVYYWLMCSLTAQFVFQVSFP